jgi:type IV pilus assembly protein PilA
MALLRCPDCGSDVSDQAPACLKCGRPTRGPGYSAAPPKQGSGSGIIILVVVLALIVPVIGILATLSIYGVRKYIANAKTAEARNTVSHVAKLAAAAYEEDHRLCPSASAPVPAQRSMIRGAKYMSSPADWQTDRAANAGFACLKFEMSMPQYFQYEYESTGDGFFVRAHGDLDGDGVYSTFEIEGRVQGGRVVVAPTISETSPEE